MVLLSATSVAQEEPGRIRGLVTDGDFDVPLAGVRVQVVGTELQAVTSPQGNYVIADVPPGTYTVVFSKELYIQQVRGPVVVEAGGMRDLDVEMPNDFTVMDEFVVEDVLQLNAGSEAALLEIRFDSPALLDSIGADLMSRAGASDAASALKLVSGASVADGKFAVIRGLPDRYVSSQLNGVRLPSADEDKRAVELDQFPAAVIESIQVSKTFTPDQQGDSSGGAVDVRLKGIPDETIRSFKAQISFNDNVAGRDDFLSYAGGGVGGLGLEAGDIDPQAVGESWGGAVGVSREDAPIDFKLSTAIGGRREVDRGLVVGGFASLFYERDSSFFDDGIDDSYWVDDFSEGLVPEEKQGDGADSFFTSLFDVARGTQTVQWGALGTVGLETDTQELALTALFTHTADDTAILAEDTRGKEYFFPGYSPDDPFAPGSIEPDLQTAPYLRSQTLLYTERDTGTLQLHGEHELPTRLYRMGPLDFRRPELDWTASYSFAHLDQPDKRIFASTWFPESYDEGVPPFTDPFFTPPGWGPFKPAANFSLGNLQRIWKTIEEDSLQLAVDLKFPFEQWDAEEGFFKVGLFDDSVDREFDTNSYSNFDDQGTDFSSPFTDPWSDVFPFEDHPITAAEVDVDYDGEQDIRAVYGMVNLPLTPRLDLVAGARFETTDIQVITDPEDEALWFPKGAVSPEDLDPGEADVNFGQDDLLPAIGLNYEVVDGVTLRLAYSRTIARQTFKELTPILQQEFVGGPIFIGNPELEMSSLENYDVRVDWVPYDGGLVSVSAFYKDIEDAIEYVQREVSFTFTSPENYPEGELKGFEFEVRQNLGHFWDLATGLSVGGNATFIDSEVTLPADEAAVLAGLGNPVTTRDATLAPEHLYNLFVTYDLEATGTQASLFYTVQGDTLVAGAGESKDNFVPSVYATEFGTLNFSLSQPLGDHWSFKFQAKNLTDPKIKEVYRSDLIASDVTKTSFTRGREYSFGVTFTP